MLAVMERKPALIPLLIARDAARAVDFYVQALGATELVRYENQRLGTISHAELAVSGGVFAVTEEAPAWNSDAPPSLGGSPVVLQLETLDVAALFERMRRAGAEVVFPLQDFCGERMGRLRDPFGHLWILSQRVEELSVEEIRARRNALFARLAATGSELDLSDAPKDPTTVSLPVDPNKRREIAAQKGGK